MKVAFRLNRFLSRIHLLALILSMLQNNTAKGGNPEQAVKCI